MRGLASSLEICAQILRESHDEVSARNEIWKRIIGMRASYQGRNAYTEEMMRGYMSVLKTLNAPEIV